MMKEFEQYLEMAKNVDVVSAFIGGTGKAKKSSTGNLYVLETGGGTALMNYSTPIMFRDADGKLYFNIQKYSVTTSKIQYKIRAELSSSGTKVEEVDGARMREITGWKHRR